MSDQGTVRHNIGCFIADKKKKVLQWEKFVKLARQENIEVHDLDLSVPISLPVKLDLVITKFNTELNAIGREVPDSNCQNIIKNYNDYIQKNRDIIQLDPIECQDKLTTRTKMLELFGQLCDKIKQLHVPSWLLLNNDDPLPNDFPYPAVCKTVEATGAMESHEMSLIWDSTELQNLKRPILLQQFINHDSTIFKVNVIGSYSYVVPRPSLRNLFTEEHQDTILRFNSQHFKALQGTPTAPLPPNNLIQSIIQTLSTDLGLTLIGLDIITCTATGKHYIIDANYFPGFAEAEDCPQKFLNLVQSKLNSSK